MRLARLDLTRYGRFTDAVLRFPRPSGGAPDLHVVYGDNEAGKTTLHNGFLDLLFGIPHNSAYGFLHPYATMQLGAALEVGDATLEVVRLKRRQGSLLDTAGQPLSDSVLSEALGGLGRAEARTMFSLDEEALEEGGESILASRGDLGQLLFAASAGLADLSERLEAVRTEAEGFRRASGRGDSALRSGRARLEELTARRREVDLQAADYAARKAALAEAEARHADAARAHAERVTAHEAARRRLSALPHLHDLRRLRAEVAALADLPEAPPDWSGPAGLVALSTLREEAAALRREAETTDLAVREAEGSVEAVALDPAALSLAPEVAAAAPLQGRAATAEEDLPNRRTTLAELRARIAALLSDLGRPGAPDPAALVIPATLTARLRALMEARAGLEAAARAARAERAEAEAQHADRAAEAGRDEAAAPAPQLDATLQRLRAADPAGQRRAAARAAAAAQAEAADRLAALAPWAGEEAALRALPVPPGDAVDRWRRDLPAAIRAAETAAAERDRLRADVSRLRAIQAAGGRGPSDAELSALLGARERAWAAHRARLDDASAEAFEAALRTHDRGAEARLRAGLADARQAERAEALAEREAAVSEASRAADAAAEDLAELRAELGAALRALGLPPEWSPEALEAWLTRRSDALTALAARATAAADLAAAEAAEAEALDALAAAGLELSGGGLGAALDAAQTRVAAAAEARRRVAALADAGRALDRRRAAAERAEAALVAWEVDWAGACAECWLGEGGAAPDLADVRAALGRLAELGPILVKAQDLAGRVAKMERDQAELAAAVAALAGLLDLPAAPPLAQWQTLSDRVAAARSAEAARREAAERLGRAQRARASCLARAEALERRRAPLCAHFGVDTLAEAERCLAALVRRAELRQAAEAAGPRLAEALDMAGPEAAADALSGAEPEALAAEVDGLAAARGAARAELDAALVAREQARDALAAIGGDDAVARIEAERAALLAELAEGARHHMRLRLGIRAVEAALVAYRERHRSGMLQRASEAFAAISRGAYVGLAAQPAGAREELIALPAEGGAKEVAVLSKGTRFQLYLALRVAGHAEFARRRQPMPFVADDIMETFDDARAEAAFAALGTMASAGQVIYLTHHRHLCAIARRAVPRAHLLEIS